jgi:hypothetical protein
MNVAAKSRSFPKRKPALLPQATASAETFVRYVTAQAQAQLLRVDPMVVANSRWPSDKSVRDVIRAVTEPPADLSTVPALAVVGTDFVESLKPISAAAQIMSNGLLLSFDRYARIVLPDFTDLDELPTPFVGPGQPAPVAEMHAQATALEPYKIEVLITATKETILGGNADRLIGDTLKRQTAFALDKVLFDAHPGDATRPPGLRAAARLAESTSIDNFTAMMQDVGRLVGAAEHIAASSQFFFVARSRRIQAMRTMMKVVAPNLTLLPSAAAQALPESALLCVVPLAFASAVGLPEVELVEHASVEMNDAPGSPDLSQGQRVRSLFQTDTVGIKLRIPASWALRNPAGANWVTAVWPSDIGGGGEGMPEAPFDEFSYGRHQGNWHPVCDEAPADASPIPYVRASAGPSGGWYPLDNFLLGYAPLISPQFGGTPRAPHPPAADASDRIATTQFVHDNAGSGGGGGIEDVPATPNAAYARVRSGGNATWVDFNTIGVAPLNSPVFTGGPTAPTPDAGELSDRLATAYYVGRDFLAKVGGQMTGALITRDGGSATNPGIAIGENSTGFYRTGANLLVTTVSGQIVMQLMPNLGAMFVPLNLGGYRIQSVADAVAPDDALNQRSGDARYLRGGAALTETLTTKPGTGVNDLGLAIGDGATGFYRDAVGVGAGLGAMVGGFPLFLLLNTREAVINGPLSMGGSRIMAVANPQVGTDALNMQSGDARYLTLQNGGIIVGPLQLYQTPFVPNDVTNKAYVDSVASPRAATVVFDIPVDYPIAADGTWKTLWNPNFPLPRTGPSLVMVSLSCNVKGLNNVALIGARINGNPERQIFGFGFGPPSNLCGGFTVNLYAVLTGANPAVHIELKAMDVGGPGQAFTVTGGGGTVPERSQVCIVDLGPAT